jgi:hypothetical protein
VRQLREYPASTVLVIETNATNWTAGNMYIIDGGVSTVAAYEPVVKSPVPEPNFLLVLSILSDNLASCPTANGI